MKKLMVIPLVAAGMAAMVGCSKTPVKEAAKNDAINLANLDTAVAPGTDFYQYACGGWIANNPLKPEYSRYGSFDRLADLCEEQMHTLVTELSEKKQIDGSIAAKVSDLYNLGLDSSCLPSPRAVPPSFPKAACPASQWKPVRRTGAVRRWCGR